MKSSKRLVLSMFFVWTIIISQLTVSPASGTQYTFVGGFNQPKVSHTISYVLSGGSSSYQQNIMNAGVIQWNGISSKVVLAGSGPNGISVYCSSTSNPDLQGVMNPYYRNWYGSLTYDSSLTNVWECADVFGYENNMSRKGYTDAQKKAIYIHEVGHAVSLAHNNSAYYLIMNQYSNDTIKALVPQKDDKDNLKIKWGS